MANYVRRSITVLYFILGMLSALTQHTTLICCEHKSRVMRKPDFCICENKEADQLRGNREADQRLCFRYTDPLLAKF